MTYAQIRAEAERVRQIPLETVLTRLGAQPDGQDRSKWNTARGVLSVTGAKFMNWRLGVGGGGAIDLVLHLTAADFKAAVVWLSDSFPGSAGDVAGLRLPAKVPGNLARVRRYLCQGRGLSATILAPLIDSGTLYADNRANAVFLMRDVAGRPVGAELRGTTAVRWRGLAPGSRKDRGHFSASPIAAVPTAVILCESAIDALSCVSLHPGAHCISTSGATSNPGWLPALLMQRREIYCAFDSDEAGERHASAMLQRYPTIKRLRSSLHDWNDELCARSREQALSR